MLSEKWHRHIFLFGLIALGAGTLFGTVPTNIPLIILGTNWLLEKNFQAKWQILKNNKVFLVSISLLILLLLGMLYTENINRGLEDIKTKLPLFVLPMILFSTKPINEKEFKLLFNFIFLSVLASSVCSAFVFYGLTKKIIVDVRQASLFMSHIRFSLFIAFSIIGMVYFSVKEKHIWLRIIYFMVICWLLFIMYKLEMATGILILGLVGFVLIFRFIYSSLPKYISLSVLFILFVIAMFVVNFAINSIGLYDENPNSQANRLLEKSINGRPYLQDTVYGVAENGNLIAININDFELIQEWPKRSTIPLDGKDKKGNSLRYTLLRYMASKGLTKDSLGLTKLSNEDVLNVENGISNYLYSNDGGLKSRWYEIIWEYTKYKRGENPSGHTLTMRLEFWKTGLYILKNNILFGVGTGDVQDSYNKAYDEMNSKLTKEWRLRCHNQYLAFSVAFGLLGLAVFLFYLIYPVILLYKKLHYLYWPFLGIALLSFITEDTLETLTGVCFFIFYQAVFLWLASYKNYDLKNQTSGN